MSEKLASEKATRKKRDHHGLSRGTNQSAGRLYNERLVLSLVRRHDALPKADIARLTGLSPQTISIITNQLSADGLLLKGAPQRGRIGQPSVPYSLNPEGAYAFGLKIGRRSVDLLLMNFAGRVVAKLREAYPYPEPDAILAFLGGGMAVLLDKLGPDQRARICGIGIAAPFELWNWEHQIGAPRTVLDHWRRIDIKAEVARITNWPVYFYNDATAACAAELMLGNPAGRLDFLYIFIGSFIGGGVVINGGLYPGRTGYAGAIGPMPMPLPGGGGHEQLLKRASIYVLADRMQAAGLDPAALWREPDDWGEIGGLLEQWIAESAQCLALMAVAAVSIIDFEAVVIDGAFPRAVRRAIVEQARTAFLAYDRQGLARVEIIEGGVGSDARAIGGACLPLLANFTQDREVLFKDNG